MRAADHLAAAFALIALAGLAQTAPPKPELLLFHPIVPLPSYEVATIKPIDANTANAMVSPPPGGVIRRAASPLNMRRYIMNAYGAMYAAQVIGGPDWLDKEAYNITGKVPDDTEAAMQKMTRDDQIDQNRMMQQSLLADRFHLKVHFETRVLPVFELVAAKGGLKITEVPAPPERKPGDPLPPPPHLGGTLPPGTIMTMMNSNGLHTINARAIPMTTLARMIGGPMSEIGDRPVIDHSGFSGYFDIKDFTWAPLGNAGAADAPDAPSLTGALEKQLGIKLVPAKDPIEVLVIDSIDRPSEN